MGSLNTSIMHFEFSPSLEKRGMKQRQDIEVPGAATNTVVLLKVHQDLAKYRLECSFGGNMRMPLLVFHSQTVFILKPLSVNTCHPITKVIACAQSDVSSTTTHHSTTLTPWSMANSSWCTPIMLSSCCPAGICSTPRALTGCYPVAVTQ